MSEYDLTDAVPEADAPVETPIKTPCVGGPWHGANITHLPGDTAPRHVDLADKPGRYEHDIAPFGPGRYAVWRWRPE